MTWSTKGPDAAAGASLLLAVVLRALIRDREDAAVTGSLAGASLLGLQVLVGVLLVLRTRRAPPTVARFAGALPCLALPLLVAGHPLTASGDWVSGVLVLAGAALAAWAFLSLGGEFAVLPSSPSRLVTSGPYRWVRHPAYVGEALVLAGLALPLPWSAAALLAFAGVAAFALRVEMEEAVLGALPGHGAYRAAVRWRMLPGVW